MKNNKAIAVVLCLLGVLQFQIATALSLDPSRSCAGYSDVTPDNEYCSAIQYVTNQNIFSGSYSIDQYASGEKFFKPYANINRAEVLKVILRAGGDSTEYNKITTYGSELGFNDTPADSAQWWFGFLKRAKELGIVKGYPDNTYRGVNPVNRAEYLKMLLEASPSAAAVHSWNIIPANQLWADTPIYAWYANYIAFANYYGLFANFTPCSTGICPDKSILRGEAALMIYNYKNYLHTDLGVVGGDTTVSCVGSGGTDISYPSPTSCCSNLISYPLKYSQGVINPDGGGICLDATIGLQEAINIYNTKNDCTSDPAAAQSAEKLPYKNQNFNGYSFPMDSSHVGCQARCDVNLDTKTAKMRWMCTGAL